MPVLEYILLALLGSAASAPPNRTLGADVIVQPNGSAALAGQKRVGQETKKDAGKITVAARRKGHHSRHARGKKPAALTVKQTSKIIDKSIR